MAAYSIKLKIADVIILMQSEFTFEQINEECQQFRNSERFKNFFYEGRAEPDVIIDVKIVDKFPQVKEDNEIFVTYHPRSGRENWRLFKDGGSYLYKSILENKQQLAFINEPFDRAVTYLLPNKDKGYSWNIDDIVYDFLQVLLIKFFALRKQGIFVHSVGVRGLAGEGFLFAGKSKAGKSTLARLWYKHSDAAVLNDDRIIVSRLNGKFFIYGSPWHGDFSDYLASSDIGSAPLEKLFFIHHSPRNNARRICGKEALCLLYPAIFPPFWDKACLENAFSFCQILVKGTPCFNLGFVNDKRIIQFVKEGIR